MRATQGNPRTAPSQADEAFPPQVSPKPQRLLPASMQQSLQMKLEGRRKQAAWLFRMFTEDGRADCKGTGPSPAGLCSWEPSDESAPGASALASNPPLQRLPLVCSSLTSPMSFGARICPFCFPGISCWAQGYLGDLPAILPFPGLVYNLAFLHNNQ